MWVTIASISLSVTYTLLYSSILLWAAPEGRCNYSDNPLVHAISTWFERNLQYVLWTYPVFWVFWPAEAHCRCSCRKKRDQPGREKRPASQSVLQDSAKSRVSLNSSNNRWSKAEGDSPSERGHQSLRSLPD